MDEYLSKKITNLRTLLILLIVFNHAPTTDGIFSASADSDYPRIANVFVQTFIADGLARIAVPLFFAISGFLFFRDFRPGTDFFITKIKRRVKTLLVPYLLYSLICLVFYYIMHSIPFTARLFRAERLLTDYSLAELLSKWLVWPIPGQLWFIRDLFIFVVLSPLIYRLLSRAGLALLLAVGTVWFCAGDASIRGDTLLAKNAEGLLFFCLGAFLVLNRVDVNTTTRGAGWLWVLWLVLLAVKTHHTVLHHQRFIALHRLSVVVGFLAVWLNYEPIRRVAGRWLYWLSLYAFAIYLFHRPMLQVYRRIAQALAGNSEMLLLAGYFACVVVAVVVSILMAWFLRAIFPVGYSVLVGGRLERR